MNLPWTATWTEANNLWPQYHKQLGKLASKYWLWLLDLLAEILKSQKSNNTKSSFLTHGFINQDLSMQSIKPRLNRERTQYNQFAYSYTDPHCFISHAPENEMFLQWKCTTTPTIQRLESISDFWFWKQKSWKFPPNAIMFQQTFHSSVVSCGAKRLVKSETHFGDESDEWYLQWQQSVLSQPSNLSF